MLQILYLTFRNDTNNRNNKIFNNLMARKLLQLFMPNFYKLALDISVYIHYNNRYKLQKDARRSGEKTREA